MIYLGLRSLATRFLMVEVPLYIFLFAVIFLLLSKITGFADGLHKSVFFIAATGALLAMVTTFRPLGFFASADLAILLGIGIVLYALKSVFQSI